MESQLQTPHGDADESPQHTSFCPFCNIHLSYPAGSQLIQCPSCNNTLDPNSAHQTRCTGCQCLLAYPPQSLYIQCPKCFTTMDPRQVGALGSVSTAPLRDTPLSSTEPKKRRDPNAPKAVCNAYMIFCKTRRGELKNQLPELAFGKIGAKLGEIWRNMTQEEKKPYEDRAAVDRERYRREMVEYTRGGGGADGGRDAKRARIEAEESAAARSSKEDEKLARDVSLQQQRAAAARARRGRHEQQQQQRQSDDSEDAQSGGEQSHSDGDGSAGASQEQGSADEEEEQE